MRLLSIDPGPTTCGVVVLDCDADILPRLRWSDPAILIDHVIAAVRQSQYPVDVVVCEWLTSYGAAVGASVLDTARVVGRIEQAARDQGATFRLLTRPEVGLELCQSRRAKKSQTAEAIRSMYREAGLAIGGGKRPTVGTKNARGPLYGVKGHAWDALAVGHAWLRREG